MKWRIVLAIARGESHSVILGDFSSHLPPLERVPIELSHIWRLLFAIWFGWYPKTPLRAPVDVRVAELALTTTFRLTPRLGPVVSST